MHKSKGFWMLLGAELICVLICIVGLFGKTRVYQYGPDVADDYIALSKGVWQVEILYSVDTDYSAHCTLVDAGGNYGVLKTNGAMLLSGWDAEKFDIWLYKDCDTLQLTISSIPEDNLVVQGFNIYETNAMERMRLFEVVCGSLFLMLCYVLYQYDKVKGIPQVNKNVAFGLIVIILLASYPLMTDEMLAIGDAGYHLMRIEGIKDGILNGQFPVRIAPEWQQGYGYASSIFYGETLLYIAAAFRVIGFSVLSSYQMFMFSVTVATACVAYYCFWKISKEKYVGLFCSMLYTLSTYRFCVTYVIGRCGETSAILFLPLIVYGFYRVFTEDTHTKEYRRSWIPLTVGFCGLVQSHLLTGELVGFFTIILCIILWKKVFRRETFTVLAKTVIYTCIISLWFLVPFADYMMRGDFQIHHVSDRTIQSRGLQLAQLFMVYPNAGGNVYYGEGGMQNILPETIGMTLMAGLFIWIFLLISKKLGELKKEECVAGLIAAGTGIMAMVMSLAIFPWDSIQSLGGIIKTLVSSLQFPGRFLTIATVCMTLVCGLLLKWFLAQARKDLQLIYVAGMVGLVIICNLYQSNSVIFESARSRVYNAEGMGLGYVAGGEYQPYGTDASLLMPRDPLAEENVQILSYEKDGLHVRFTCSNTGDKEGGVALPLLFYRGYCACDEDTGDAIPLMDGVNHNVTVAVPAGYKGTILVSFESPWYWRVAELISILSFVGLVVLAQIERRKEKALCAK